MKRRLVVLASVFLVAALCFAMIRSVTFWGAVATWWRGDDWYEAEGRVLEITYALADYRKLHGSYPSQQDGLAALLKERPEESAARTYFPDWYRTPSEMLTDPWGRPIQYEIQPNGRCVVFSLGADGTTGGRRDAKDIAFECPPLERSR